MKRIFLLAGESSGDLQGALLAEQLLERDPTLELVGVGGDKMEQAGVKLLLRSEEFAVIGLFEVLAVLPKILGALRTIKRSFRADPPDLFVPIDYPDFNFRLLGPARRLGIPIIYYIGPQVWAWRSGRVAELKRHVEQMLVIFPFEEEFYREHNVPVQWVGHPLVDQIPEEATVPALTGREKLTIAVLPGSRRSEVSRLGPVLGETRRIFDQLWRADPAREPIDWVYGQAPALSESPEHWLGEGPWRVSPGVDALREADLALVASGTATLEALLRKTPSIVVYRVNSWTYHIAKRVVRVPNIAMANLVAGETLFPEFIQDDAEPSRIAAKALELILDPQPRDHIHRGLQAAREKLGPPGAAGRAADAIVARVSS